MITREELFKRFPDKIFTEEEILSETRPDTSIDLLLSLNPHTYIPIINISGYITATLMDGVDEDLDTLIRLLIKYSNTNL